MNTTEHLLTCLAEECAEVQKAVSKALRFGVDNHHPDSTESNSHEIARELIDILAVTEELRRYGIIPHIGESTAMYQAKRRKLNNHMDLARDIGTLV